MPITEIRETIEQTVTWIQQSDGSSLGIVTRRIEIQPNRRHTLMSVDFMDDSLIIPQDVSFLYEAMVSTYPIFPTFMSIGGFLGRGPCGADDSLLFKQTSSSTTLPTSSFQTQRMPNNFLGSMPTYSWYTPQLYLTIFVHAQGTPATDLEIACSFYMSVKDRAANDVEYAIGCIGEYDEAQTRQMMSVGRMIGPNVARYTGEVYPSWKFGGIRPEGMVKANTKMNFFLPGYMQGDAESMVSRTDIGTMVKEARTMVGFDQAFGVDSGVAAGGFAPDWLKFIDTYDFGYGNVRPQFPPAKKFDNGNTEML